jgi:hypothetical protein
MIKPFNIVAPEMGLNNGPEGSFRGIGHIYPQATSIKGGGKISLTVTGHDDDRKLSTAHQTLRNFYG